MGGDQARAEAAGLQAPQAAHEGDEGDEGREAANEGHEGDEGLKSANEGHEGDQEVGMMMHQAIDSLALKSVGRNGAIIILFFWGGVNLLKLIFQILLSKFSTKLGIVG